MVRGRFKGLLLLTLEIVGRDSVRVRCEGRLCGINDREVNKSGGDETRKDKYERSSAGCIPEGHVTISLQAPSWTHRMKKEQRRDFPESC